MTAECGPIGGRAADGIPDHSNSSTQLLDDDVIFSWNEPHNIIQGIDEYGRILSLDPDTPGLIRTNFKVIGVSIVSGGDLCVCLLYTSPSPRDS